MNKFNKLATHKFKVVGYLMSALAFVMLITFYALNFQYQAGWEERIFIFNHYLLLMGLIMVMNSREVREDEGVQKVRQAILKFSNGLLIFGILFYVTLTALERVDFSIFILLYIIEGVLVLYILLFRYCLVKSPDWVFTEKHKKKAWFVLMLLILIILFGWIIFSVITYRI